MHGEGFFFQAFVYLVAAVVAVPIAKRLGLGSVLGYLLAGMAIGPFALGLIGDEGQDVMHFAEFGVVMMLFLVGLELRPALLWRLRGPILGVGGLQVATTTAAGLGIGLALGLPWQMALAIGMILALSSTAIVLQSLAEKGLLKTDGGQNAFAVLLFQDIAVIPMLALLPLLAVGHASGSSHGASAAAHHPSWFDALPAWVQTLVVLGAVAAVIIAGLFLVRPLLRLIAQTRLPELFTATALLLVIGIALLMTQVGLSPALGTFLAGVVLANSEYRHELESDIEPFKGLLLGLFFIAVGASIDFGLLAQRPGMIASLVGALVLVKFVILVVLGRAFRMGTDQISLFAFSLAQGGEFAFVLLSFASQSRVLGTAQVAPLAAAVALSMALTPLLLLLHDRFVQPRLGTKEREEREADVIDHESPVIIAGFGRFGNIVGRLLRASGVETTVLDLDSDHVDVLRRLGLRVFYGDASRHELLRSAGADRAKLIVLAVDEHEKTLELVATVKKHFPRLTILARAAGRTEAYELLDTGVEHVYRETFDSSLRLGTEALRLLGFRANQAFRSGKAFRRHDEAALRELAEHRHDRKEYLRRAKQRITDFEELLVSEQERALSTEDAAWDSAALRDDARRRVEEARGADARDGATPSPS